MSKTSRSRNRSLALPSLLMSAMLFTAACDPNAAGPEGTPEGTLSGADESGEQVSPDLGTSDGTPGEVLPGDEEETEVSEMALATTLTYTTLRVSPYANRTSNLTLSGTTLKGNVAIYLALANTGVQSVKFYLDDPYRSRAPISTDLAAPYDFAGTGTSTSVANLYDTRKLANGQHTLSVLVTYTTGKQASANTKFYVSNLTTEPAPAPEPTPTPTPTPTPPTTPTGLRSVADWEKLFLARWSADHSLALAASNSLDSWQFYNLGYYIDANTAMYRATGKTQYLDRALLYVNNVVAHAKVSSSLSGSQFKDSYLGWASARSDTYGQEVPLFESYCWRYVTRMLRVIKETPALYGNATYRAQYDRLLAFTERNMFEKWNRRGANSYVYRNRTHMASHWAYIAMDLSRMTTDATKKASYLTVFNNVNRSLPNVSSSLRGQLTSNPLDVTGYFWSDVWGSRSRPGQDVAHGNAVVAFVVEAHDAGMEWTDSDIRAFRTTFARVIWPTAGKYASYVDGSGAGTGWFNDGFVKLGRYDAALQRRLEAHTVGMNTQFYGNGALNVRLLSEGSAI